MPDRAVRPSPEILRALADLVARREPLVLVTVTAASGSAPGKSGAKLIVLESGQVGTVGGGKVERAALERAREILRGAREPGAPVSGPETKTYHVTQDLGMTCGGSMTVVFEPMTPPPRLVLFGAGHLSESLCAMAALAGFDVTVCDDRPDWLSEERFPQAGRRLLLPWTEAVASAGLDASTFVACVTPGHATDEEVVLKILKSGVRPRYLGVIGSRRKAVILRKGLLERGRTQAEAEAIHIPMGLEIGAVDPREIAVSVMAELVAILRGKENPRPW